MCCVRFAGKSGVSVRNFSAVCASGDFNNDERERRRSPTLRSRQNREWNFLADWAPGIACALRSEPVKCTVAGRRGRVVEGRCDCRCANLVLINSRARSGLTGPARIFSLIALNTGALTAFARSPADQIRADAERLSHIVLEMQRRFLLRLCKELAPGNVSFVQFFLLAFLDQK